jgi:hypothetical protein
MRPSKVVLSGIVNLGALGIAYHACPHKGTLKSHQPFLPCTNGTFLLSRSLSRARSCSRSSIATADITASLEGGGEDIHQPTSDDQLHKKK